MSAVLLSNYVLAISLMKNISKKYSDPGAFEREFPDDIDKL